MAADLCWMIYVNLHSYQISDEGVCQFFFLKRPNLRYLHSLLHATRAVGFQWCESTFLPNLGRRYMPKFFLEQAQSTLSTLIFKCLQTCAGWSMRIYIPTKSRTKVYAKVFSWICPIYAIYTHFYMPPEQWGFSDVNLHSYQISDEGVCQIFFLNRPNLRYLH